LLKLKTLKCHKIQSSNHESYKEVNEMRVRRLFLCTRVYILWRRYSGGIKVHFYDLNRYFAIKRHHLRSATERLTNVIMTMGRCVCLEQQVNNDKIKMPSIQWWGCNLRKCGLLLGGHDVKES
jgi:hypothetical protein